MEATSSSRLIPLPVSFRLSSTPQAFAIATDSFLSSPRTRMLLSRGFDDRSIHQVCNLQQDDELEHSFQQEEARTPMPLLVGYVSTWDSPPRNRAFDPTMASPPLFFTRSSRTTIHTMLSLTARTTTRSARALFVARRGYHENIVEHYENPRNVGSLDKTDEHVGTVGSGEVSCDCWLVEQHDACRMHGRFMHDA